MKKRLIAVMAFAVAGAASAAPVVWEEYATNPIITGTAEAYYPTVVYDAAQFSGQGEPAPYKMWCDKNLQYYTSSDGIVWTLIGNTLNGVITGVKSTIRHALVEYYPVGFPGVNSGSNPSDQTMYYRLWYWDSAIIYAVSAMRYADSPDGKAWFNDQPLKNGAVPIVSGNFDPGWCRGTYGPSDVLHFPGASNTGTDWAFRMYYDGTTGGAESLGLGFSADGVTWTAYDSAGDGRADPILAGGPASWDLTYVSRCTVIIEGGEHRMWYSGGVGAMDHGIGYAVSTDGITWTKDMSNPVLHKTDANGDPSSVAYWRYNSRTYTPMVVYDSAGFSGHGDNCRYKMWFTGQANWNALGSVAGYARAECAPPNNPPVARCRSVSVTAGDNCAAVVSIDDGSYDPDGGAVTLTQNPPGPFPMGSTTVTLTVTDGVGATDTCTATVTVKDTTPPTITCPADIVVAPAGPAGAHVTFAPLVDDICSGVTAACSPVSGSLFPIGTTLVTCTATDAAGNQSSCAFTVTVRAPNAMKQQVLDAAVALLATLTDKEDRSKLSYAIEHLQKSLSADRWLDALHPKPGSKGEGVFNEEKPAVLKFRELRNSNDSGLTVAQMQGYIDALLATDRLLAEIAIAEAEARGGNAGKIATAREELIKGDAEAGKDHPDKAIDKYKNAWKNAVAA